MDARIDDHESRIRKLEEAVTAFRLELKESVNTMIKWTVGTVLGAAVAGITVITFVLNHASPQPPAALPQMCLPCPSPHPSSCRL